MSSLMDVLAVGLFWLAAVSLAHVYFFYELILRFVVRLFGDKQAQGVETCPFISLLLTVHDEQEQIIARLNDLLAQGYPPDRLEIVVASDGSTDQTEDLVRAFAADHPNQVIRLVPVHPQGGKSKAQNIALPQLIGDVVVLTDADTRFAPDFLARITAPFVDQGVGCVSGQVVFALEGTAISQGQGRYWRSEMTLRDCESRLGILAIASGQAMAFRRILFQPLPEHIGDDCIIPLDVAVVGSKVVHQPDAIAYDANESYPRRELRARARMTARNWVGTWRHLQLLSPWQHPGYAIALWSHKLMRWLSPLFLLVMAMTSLWLAGRPFYAVCLAGGLGVCVMAGFGYYAQTQPTRSGLFWRSAGLAFAFLIAQLGFLMGLWKVVCGQKIFSYRNIG